MTNCEQHRTDPSGDPWAKAFWDAWGQSSFWVIPYQGDSVTTVQDFFNWRIERSPTAGDVTHYAASEWVYDLPRLTGMGTAALRRIAGGWQVSGIFIGATGPALLISQPSGHQGSRPDYVGGPAILNDYIQTLQYLNKAAFRPVPVSSVSGAPLRLGI